jgi:2-oxoglutarate dehydrogenase E1 component
MAVDSTVQVVMPQMGDSVTEGTILEWHKKEGDNVSADETLVEISTDKVDAEVPVPVNGTIVKTYGAEGDTIEVGALLAEISTAEGGGTPDIPATAVGDPASEGESLTGTPSGEAAEAEAEHSPDHDSGGSAANANGGSGNGASAAAPAQAPPAAHAAAPPGEGEETVEVVMPQMGESVSEGTILEWHKQAGESIEVDETIVEISTDKVDAEVPSPASGTITEILAEAGETVTVGQVLARMTAGAGAAQAPTPAPTPSSAPRPGTDATEAAAPAPVDGDGKASPVARRVAAAEGIELGRVQGSGPGGRITKDDVLAAARNGGGSATPAPAQSAAPAPTGGSAQLIKGASAMLARYMDESRSIPTATSFRTLTVTALDARRKQLKAAGQKVSFTHLIAYAIARAATEDIPVMAHHFEERDGKPHRIDDGAVNLGLAVDVQKKDGSRTLMVPIIRDAGRLSFSGFLDAYNALVEKARTNTLTADDLTGGNISLTNPGGIGTVASVPRLMTGQGTIIATGSIAYPVGLGAIGEMIGAEKVMTMTSTYDHRIIQGAESGRFLQRVEGLLQGDDEFYERVFSDLGAELGELPPPPTPAAAAAAVSTAPAGADGADGAPSEQLLQAVQAATSLLKAHRTHGHLAARLDPLGSEPVGDPALDPDSLSLTPELMAQIPASILRMHVPGATLADALPHLRDTYCGTIAYEIEHISSHQQRVWLREKIESGAFRRPLTNEEQKQLLKRLTEVDGLERFMHKAYLGQKQFSVEGLDMTVPMLDEMIQLAAAQGAREVVIGMAHRGRLNVLAHNLGRPYDTIFAEFEGASTLEAITTIPQGGTGDVKYHHGAEGSYQLQDGHSVIVRLESNPSHLEYVGPVAQGATRAVQTTRQGPHAHLDTNAAMPIVLHGDAAFPGQGVVAETLNLQGIDGYRVGGTLHLIQNNQVGFTTDPDDSRSTRWASDLAKGYDVPIIHVNADDVAACVTAVRLAFAFRQEFGHDVLIDLIGYRRFGHNEADEPAYTQPEMYQQIKKHPSVRELYSKQLVEQGVVSDEEAQAMNDSVWEYLTNEHLGLKSRIANHEEPEQQTGEYRLDRSPSPTVTTAVGADRLLSLNEELLRVPEGFTVHPKLVKQLDQRREAVGADGGINWAQAESLAFASLLTEGTPVRLTGQDAERGTFSQRHMVLHDAKTGQEYCPMQNLPGALAPMELHNSPLSEIACLGFEYGYAQEGPETLVIWEAQFGDFANSAQVIIDQFIISGLAKWGASSRLTLLLPHGYEGSGPEHSSARLERFLQLAAEGNIRVANCTTPAQYFHLLRRQARIAKQRPLVLMTPKSLLRLPQATNRIEHLSETQFYPVLGEPRVDEERVTRLILCTGKIYYDIVGHADREDKPEIAVGRVELLYPFPQAQILELIERYPNLTEVVWVQEEPRNMGARAHMSPRLMQILPDQLAFGYIGRPERASPGEGYPAAHVLEQSRIVRTALDLSRPVAMYPTKDPGER